MRLVGEREGAGEGEQGLAWDMPTWNNTEDINLVSGGCLQPQDWVSSNVHTEREKKSKGPWPPRVRRLAGSLHKLEMKDYHPLKFTAELLLETWRDLKKHNQKNLFWPLRQ